MGRRVRLTRLPHITEQMSRHGRVSVYFWRGRGHRKIRLRAEPNTEEFFAEYAAAAAMDTTSAGKSDRIAQGTLRWLVVRYLGSPAYLRLGKGTQAVRRGLLEHCLQEPIAPGRSEMFADFPLEKLTAKAIRVLRDRKGAAIPEAANGRVKALRQVFRWAIEEELVASDPARDVAYIRTGSEGFHSWTPDEVQQYQAAHPIGTKGRLAFDLLLYTGQRRGDVVLMGRQHVRDGWLRLTQGKTRQTIEIPVLPALQASIDAGPTGDLTFLVTEYGRPFTAAGFGNWFKKQTVKAGLPDRCAAHGLRKAGATIAAENGATEHQLMAIFGWLSPKEAARYTRQANRKRLAGAGMGFMMRRDD